ncbi:hypothetical protein PQ455_12425 [Sphingomonas naphthae]|uniref:Uncharacterized protein n=1 Tax=Sphingomonas naphthae TaxID=1813468 RepID=A0ABY7THI2_9SPHN|nr:hypothetical protein [Sphingomonas naphthae]WCT72441.1 hypothetical protein PQ455_12425 [Sphingomonas naphthae]
MRRTIIASTIAVALMPAGGALAQTAAPTPSAVAAVFACRQIAAGAERLACFDKASAALETAAKDREVVVLDRAEVKRTRKSLFGFQLPRIPLFGGGEGKSDKEIEREVEAEDVSEIDAVIKRSTALPYGFYRIVLDEGGTWETTEGWRGAMDPTPGSKINIKRGALGSHMLKVPGGRAIKAKRVN